MTFLPALVAAALLGATTAAEAPSALGDRFGCQAPGGPVHVERDAFGNAVWDPFCARVPSGGSVTWENADPGLEIHEPGSALDRGACFRAERDGPGDLRLSWTWTVHFRAAPEGLEVSFDGLAWKACPGAAVPDPETGSLLVPYRCLQPFHVAKVGLLEVLPA